MCMADSSVHVINKARNHTKILRKFSKYLCRKKYYFQTMAHYGKKYWFLNINLMPDVSSQSQKLSHIITFSVGNYH